MLEIWLLVLDLPLENGISNVGSSVRIAFV